MAKLSPVAKVAEDGRLQLLKEIAGLISRAKNLNLHDSVLLLNMAHLDLQTKIHDIDDRELQAFLNIACPSVQNH